MLSSPVNSCLVQRGKISHRYLEECLHRVLDSKPIKIRQIKILRLASLNLMHLNLAYKDSTRPYLEPRHLLEGAAVFLEITKEIRILYRLLAKGMLRYNSQERVSLVNKMWEVTCFRVANFNNQIIHLIVLVVQVDFLPVIIINKTILCSVNNPLLKVASSINLAVNNHNKHLFFNNLNQAIIYLPQSPNPTPSCQPSSSNS